MLREPLGNHPLACPLSAGYGAVVGARNWLFDHLPAMSRISGYPVVSVGGIRAGGTGKTPLALRVGEALRTAGHQVAFVSRGYGRKRHTPAIVAPGEPADWRMVGDEPALLRRNIPQAWLVVDHNRLRGLRLLRTTMSATERLVAILDDGFQHRWVHRNLDIVCLSPQTSSERLIPSGYLREPLHSLRRADVICIIGAGDQKTQLLSEMEKLREKSAAHEVFVLIQEPGMWVNCATGEQAAELPLQRPAVVSGIARPERFERFVTASGKKVVRTVRFPDHHPFSASEIRAAVSAPADGLATTEKDALRLRTVELADLSHIWYLRLRLVFVQPYAEERFCRMVMEGTLC